MKGCRISSMIQVFTGMQLSVRLHVPGASGAILVQNAAVRWCGAQGMGLEFLVIGAAEEDRLKRVVQNLDTPRG